MVTGANGAERLTASSGSLPPQPAIYSHTIFGVNSMDFETALLCVLISGMSESAEEAGATEDDLVTSIASEVSSFNELKGSVRFDKVSANVSRIVARIKSITV
jgi:hypothetical protein